jgi:adenylylsulfate kinase-like enzyme|tara:strand:+ start:3826 stop:4320 length:495 start_codon:yes stop_codon:yes gene_type:complete
MNKQSERKNIIIWLTGQPGSGKTTLANELIKSIDSNEGLSKNIINLDGDDLRLINKNKDYSKEGRIKNISTAISIVRFLANKNYNCILSIVAPYRFLRDELKEDFPLLEVYLHTSEIRGREEYFAKDYEPPVDPNSLKIDTGNLTIKESVDEILNVYRKMATVA